VSVQRPSLKRFFFQFRARIKIPDMKMLPAIEGAVVRVLHQPHLSIAFAGVKLCHCPVDIQENGLRNVFRLTGIADNLQRDAQDELLVTVKEDSKGIVLSVSEARHELIVG
jgi:hypothetical protein